MHNLDHNILNDIALGDKFIYHYDDRVNTILEWVSYECGIGISIRAIEKNKALGRIIMKNFMLKCDMEVILNISGYNYFKKYSHSDFDREILRNDELSKSIANGNSLIGYNQDFDEIYIVSEFYSFSDAVTDLIH